MTGERDGKSGRGPPDLLAGLPPAIDPAMIEELLTGVRALREEVAGLREAVSAERQAPVPSALTPEALEAWGDRLVARVAEAARTAAAPADEAAAARLGRIEDAAARAAAAAERTDGGQESSAARLAAEIEGAVARIERGFQITRDHVGRQARLTHEVLEDIRRQTAGPRFGWRTLLGCLIVFVLGMVLESYIDLFHRWL